MVNHLAVAAALHRLVAWGVKDSGIEQPEILRLLSVHRQALLTFGTTGAAELATTAMRVLAETVGSQSEPIRSAAQELLWITEDGPRSRSLLPSAQKRRAKAIDILNDGGYFSVGEVPDTETWRRGLETEFFSNIARQLTGGTDTAMPQSRAGFTPAPSPGEPNAGCRLLLVEVQLKLDADSHSIASKSFTIQAMTSHVESYDLGPTGPSLWSPMVEVHGAKWDIGAARDSAKTARVVRFPAPLRPGQRHTFQYIERVVPGGFYINSRIGLESVPWADGYCGHTVDDVPIEGLHVRVVFPSDVVPDEVFRIVAAEPKESGRIIGRPHAVHDGTVQTHFYDLVPDFWYGIRFPLRREHYSPRPP